MPPRERQRQVKDGERQQIAVTVSAERPITDERDRIVAETVTGASISIAKGFCSPPVRNNRMPSCNVS